MLNYLVPTKAGRDEIESQWMCMHIHSSKVYPSLTMSQAGLSFLHWIGIIILVG